MNIAESFALISVFSILVASCAYKTDLEPAAAAHKSTTIPNDTSANESGVKISAQTGEWPGPVDIGSKVQPMRIIIENRSGKPLLITYENFVLWAPAKGRTRHSFLSKSRGQRKSLRWKAKIPRWPDRLLLTGVLSYLQSIVPSILNPPCPKPDKRKPYLLRTLPPEARGSGLPTPAMLRKALPEGALQDGGSMDGYLYFEKIPPEDDSKVTFRAECECRGWRGNRDFGDSLPG